MALLVADGVRIYEADLDNFTQAVRGMIVPTGCTVAAQGAPNMSVQITAGELITGVARVAVGSLASLAIAAADLTNPRIDMVTLDAAGTLAAVTGAPVATPKPAALPAGRILLAYVSVSANATSIITANITDRRQTRSHRLTRGTLANRPSAANVGEGATYFVTDLSSGRIDVSDGAAWVPMTPTVLHAAAHNAGGTDVMAIDAAAGTGSLRTLGAGATQAAAGTHTHTGSAPLDKDVTTITIGVSSVAEADLYRKTINANVIGALGGLHIVIVGDALQNQAATSPNYTFRVKFGATTIFTGILTTVTQSATRIRWEVEVYMLQSATNAQRWFALFKVTDQGTGMSLLPGNGFVDAADYGVSAEDTTASADFAVTGQNSQSSANDDIRKQFALLEAIV